MYPDFPIERLNILAKTIADWVFDEAKVCPSDMTMITDNLDYSVLTSRIMDDLYTQVCGEMLYRCLQYRKAIAIEDLSLLAEVWVDEVSIPDESTRVRSSTEQKYLY